MTNQLAKAQMCILIRGDVEIWVDKERAESLMEQINKVDRLFQLDGRIINVADIVGIFTPDDMREKQFRSRGLWKCKYNKWHEKGGVCECGRVG